MNLGQFTKPLLLFGGPYSNLNALLALREQASLLNIAPDHIICTGDIVAYCGQPHETVECIRDWGIHVLMGNCEESFANDADGCGCGFGEGSSCDLLSVEWFQFANTKLKPDQRLWFSQLPTQLDFTINNKTASVVHGSATAINQFIFPSTDDSEFIKQFQHTQTDIIIAGHSGIPFTKKINNGALKKLWHNAGAIGMPANDGNTCTWYSVLSPMEDGIAFESHRLHYDHLKAKTTMIAEGLNTPYAMALENGLWPSMDILPKAESEQQGNNLQIDNNQEQYA